MEENRRFAIIWSSAQMIYWVYCIIMSARDPSFLICRNIYIAAFSVNVTALVLAVFFAPRAMWLMQPVALAVDIAFLGAGICIARLLAPKTIVIFASVLVVPVFFICNSLSTMLLLAVNVIVFSMIGRTRMEAETYHWCQVNLIIFSSIGLTLGYFVNKARLERYYYAESAVQLAELQSRYAYYDQLTGLQNRRAFEEKIDQFRKNMPDDCCIIIVDINGLKEMNDTHGHDAGDELIIGATECLRRSFENVDLIYRIGGDEFCVIMNDTEKRVEECLKLLEENGRNWNGRTVNGISISCGFASGKEFSDPDSMLKAADQRMYNCKRSYYRTSGRDRRRR